MKMAHSFHFDDFTAYHMKTIKCKNGGCRSNLLTVSDLFTVYFIRESCYYLNIVMTICVYKQILSNTLMVFGISDYTSSSNDLP